MTDTKPEKTAGASLLQHVTQSQGGYPCCVSVSTPPCSAVHSILATCCRLAVNLRQVPQRPRRTVLLGPVSRCLSAKARALGPLTRTSSPACPVTRSSPGCRKRLQKVSKHGSRHVHHCRGQVAKTGHSATCMVCRQH